MSSTNMCTQTNEFKVKPNVREEVKEVFRALGFEIYDRDNGKLQAYADSDNYFDDTAEVIMSVKPIKINAIEKNLICVSSDMIDEFDLDLDTIMEEHGLEEKDLMIIPIVEYLQDCLEENTGLLIECAGFTVRCSGTSEPFGDVTIITKNDTKFMSITKYINEISEQTGIVF